MLFWIYFCLLNLVFVLQWISFIFSLLLPQFYLTFLQTLSGIDLFIAVLLIILLSIRTVFVIIEEMYHGKISLIWVLLLFEFWRGSGAGFDKLPANGVTRTRKLVYGIDSSM